MHPFSRRAFTLIDTAVASAVIALAIAALLPALRTNRNASQADVSRANLKTLMRAHLAYTITNQGKWLNPFNPTTNYNGVPSAADPEWYSIRLPSRPGYVWRMNDTGFQTEMYALHWAAAARADMLGGDAFSPVQFDPRDSELMGYFQQVLTLGPVSDLIWANSYMYSPTMWFNPARYDTAARGSITAPNQLGGVHSVRYNTTAETTYPSQKVVLFARADFDLTSYTRGGQTVQRSPQWNNAVAVPDAAFADGSVDEVSIRKVQNAISAGSNWLTPTNPNWNLPTSLLSNYNLGTNWENGQNNTALWPAFFWGTRNGVAGRDIPRRSSTPQP